MSRKLVLIDGHSILHRAFYGVPDLTNSEGIHTNAIYGFLNILFKLLDEEQPDYLIVAFDVNAPTFRHKMYDAYKGTRKPMPDELRQQVPLTKQVLSAMGIVTVEQAGLEADDVLGTVAKKAEADGLEVSLISGDRDLLQIASDHIKIRIPKTKGSKTEIEDYYAKDVFDRMQVTPEQFIELKALMGDTADNIPGVPKIGEKTATALMVKYGSIEQIYAHIDEITKKSIKQSLIENRDLAELSKTLATIRTDCDINIDYREAKAEGFFTKEAYELFHRLEFKNFMDRFDEETKQTGNNILSNFKEIQTCDKFINIIEATKKSDTAGFFLLQEEDEILGLSVAFSDSKIYYISGISAGDVAKCLSKLSEMATLSTFDIKKEYCVLDEDKTDRYFDVLIASYLLNPLKNDYEIEDIALEQLGLIIPGKKEVFEKNTVKETLLKNHQSVVDFSCYCAYVSLKTCPILKDKLKESGMDFLMDKIEMPLSCVLYDMECEGIEIKTEELKKYGEVLDERIKELKEEIYSATGERFNINSPKQLGNILFEKLGLPGGKKTRTGYSTAADILEKLSFDYPVVKSVLEYRGLTKLKSTYVEGLVTCVEKDGRIHTSFNQTITATGRISSTEPNLQNIPMRTELGRRIRKVFVPKDGFVFIDADYSQIELRVLAHLSGDQKLIEAYRKNEDIHRTTASEVFHVPFNEVTDLQRRNAKAVNFGIIYGISSFGLSQDLSITRKEAEKYITQYFETYPLVREFLDKLVQNAKKNGYTTTMFGRRRPIPELKSSNFMKRSFGERVAMNSPIQGTAADIIKIAMIKVQRALKKEHLDSRLILQVHDELLIEAKESEEKRVREILNEQMKEAVLLAVTLEIDVHSGKTWYDAK